MTSKTLRYAIAPAMTVVLADAPAEGPVTRQCGITERHRLLP